MSRVTAVLCALGALTAATGCGTEKLDTGKVESRLKEQLSTQGTSGTSITPGTSGTTITSVDCPKEVEQKKGTSFECNVEAEGGLSGTVKVTQKDSKGKGFDYSAHLEGEGSTTDINGSL